MQKQKKGNSNTKIMKYQSKKFDNFDELYKLGFQKKDC